MFSQGDQEYQFQQTVQQAAFGTTKVGLDSTQSMLSLLNEDEFSQQQQQQQQQQPVNCQPLSYYSNQITSNNYGSLPTQVQRNYLQYAQQSQGMTPSPYATTNSSYPLQQGYQRTNSYQAPYANQHSGAYYPNTPMTTQSPYQGYGTTQSYPNQGRSPASSPNMLPTAPSIGPKYPQIPPNTASPGMGQGSTMYSPGSTPVSNRNQFQFPTSPVPHLARPSPIQSPSAPKRSPASMTCPSPIQSHSPAPVGTTNSTSPLTVRSPQNNSPSFNQNRSPAQGKQKQEMVDLSSMSKMYHPPSRANSDSDKKHTYSSPKRGGPIPKMEEMVAFIGEPTMRGVLASDIDGEMLSSDLKSDDKMSNGKLDSSENSNSKTSESGNSKASENGNSKEPENGNSKEPENGNSKEPNIVDNGTNKSNSKNDAVDEICENGKTVSSQPETETKQTATEKTETETASNEVSQHEVPRVENKELEKCSELNESSKTNNRKRKSLSDVEPQANPKTNDSGKTKRTKPKAGSKASVGENKLHDSKSKNKSKTKTSGKIQSKKTPKRASTKDSMENGFTTEGSDDHGFSDDDDSDLNGKRLTLNRPIKTYSKIQNSKDKDDVDCSKDSKSDFDEIMKTAQTRDNVIETEKKNEKIKSDTKVGEKCEKIEFAKISEMECKDEEVSITKVETKNEENIKEKKDNQIVECEIKLDKKNVIQEVKNPMVTPSLKRQLTEVDGPDTCESDHAVASHKKRGRPFGSKNKKKRLTKKERALLESECLDKDFLSAAKKIAVKQSVMNTKLAAMLQPSGSISKPVGPVLRIVGAPENPVSSHIVNQPNANVDATISKKNKSIVSSKIVHMPSSSAAVGSTYCETGRPWLCALCGKPSNENGLGDLYGPYYPEGFKPPKRCTQDEQVTPQSTKQTPKGKTLKSNSKTSNSKNNSQRRRSSIEKEIDINADQITANKNTPKSRSSSKGKATKNSKSATKNSSTPSSKRTSSTDTETSCHLDEIWVHEECAVWAQGVYLVGGMIYGLHETVKAACQTSCTHCKQMGATLGCFSKACSWTSHFICSKKADCLLREENYSMLCPKHKNRMVKMKDDT